MKTTVNITLESWGCFPFTTHKTRISSLATFILEVIVREFEEQKHVKVSVIRKEVIKPSGFTDHKMISRNTAKLRKKLIKLMIDHCICCFLSDVTKYLAKASSGRKNLFCSQLEDISSPGREVMAARPWGHLVSAVRKTESNEC